MIGNINKANGILEFYFHSNCLRLGRRMWRRHTVQSLALPPQRNCTIMTRASKYALCRAPCTGIHWRCCSCYFVDTSTAGLVPHVQQAILRSAHHVAVAWAETGPDKVSADVVAATQSLKNSVHAHVDHSNRGVSRSSNDQIAGARH